MKKISSLLLIDNNAAVNRLNQVIVEDLAVADEVYIAENGLEALNLIVEGKICPNVIVMDFDMPVMDGLTFLTVYSQLPTTNKKATVLISSDTSPKSDIAEIAEMRIIKEYLEKPIAIKTWQRLQMTYGD